MPVARGCFVADNAQIAESGCGVLRDRIRSRLVREQQRRREEEKETAPTFNWDTTFFEKLLYSRGKHGLMVLKQLRVQTIEFTSHDRALDR